MRASSIRDGTDNSRDQLSDAESMEVIDALVEAMHRLEEGTEESPESLLDKPDHVRRALEDLYSHTIERVETIEEATRITEDDVPDGWRIPPSEPDPGRERYVARARRQLSRVRRVVSRRPRPRVPRARVPRARAPRARAPRRRRASSVPATAAKSPPGPDPDPDLPRGGRCPRVPQYLGGMR